MYFRKTLLILLIFSISLLQMGNWVIQIGFDLNRDYISKNLCENRFKPISLCLGSCYLKKEIKRNHQKQSTLSPKSIQVLAVLSSSFGVPELFQSYSNNYSDHKVQSIILRPTLIGFRPPASRS